MPTMSASEAGANGLGDEGPENGKVKVKAMVTERVGLSVPMPFHFRRISGKDLRSKYPDGADPYVLSQIHQHCADLRL